MSDRIYPRLVEVAANKAPFVLGLFVAIPLAVQSIPYIGFIFFLLAPIIVIGNLILFKKLFNVKVALNINVIVFFCLVITFLYGIFRTDQEVSFAVWKDFARGGIFFLAAVYWVQSSSIVSANRVGQLLDCFSISVLVISVTASLLGMFKFFALLQGYSFDILYSNEQIYPWGTSIVGDYNFYALTLLIGGLFALRYWASAKTEGRALAWAFIAGLIFFIGWYAGSRRYWLVAPIAVVSYLVIIFTSQEFKKYCCSLKSLLFGAALAVLMLQFGVYFYSGNRFHGQQSSENIQSSETSQNFEYRLSTVQDSSVSFGLQSRIDRWLYAFCILTPTSLLIGQGFDYRHDYGCKFLNCTMDDYPHAPIISALLSGGIVSALIVSTCLLLAAFYSVRLLKLKNGRHEIGIGMISTLLFVVISGDSLFSVPVFCGMLMVTIFANYHCNVRLCEVAGEK